MGWILGIAAFCVFRAEAQPLYKGNLAYADTVRVLVLTNSEAGGHDWCPWSTKPVGKKTEEFVRKSLSPLGTVQYRESKQTQWADVVKAWPGKLPHVIVYLNSGWHDKGGPHIENILNTAADSAIGVVSIGDDAGHLGEKVFGFRKENLINEPLPLRDGSQLDEPADRLWINLKMPGDTLTAGEVIRNTVDSLKVAALDFKPIRKNEDGDFRCQADADKYQVDPTYLSNLTFMGFQRAYDHSEAKELHTPEELQVIVAFQDRQRRGVALSFQPQFLSNDTAAHQIVYDAVVYASYAHTYHEAALAITDGRDGASLAAGAIWSPAKGKLYLTYSDDFAGADLSKSFTLTVRNRQGAAPADTETVTAKPALTRDGKSVWLLEIPLAESRTPAPRNGTLQTLVVGEVTVTTASHSYDGTPDGGLRTATVKVAYPDQKESAQVLNAEEPATPVGDLTRTIRIEVKDQDYSSLAGDTVVAQVKCEGSGDVIARAILTERSPGVYQSEDIAKTRGPASPGDAALSCSAADAIVVSYVDEVYGTAATHRVAWNAYVPPMNPITSAHIRDMDGDGAGDRVFFTFGRRLDSLPASIDTVYWNGTGPAFANRKPPVLQFAAGADQKTVVADFSASPFPAGLTGIAPGARPYAVFPSTPIFAGQKPLIADSMGPVLVKASISPFNFDNWMAGAKEDTLVLTFSEPLRAKAGWDSLVRFSLPVEGKCADYDGSMVVLPGAPPAAGPDGLTYTLTVKMEKGPLKGDCIFLNAGGDFTDTSANLPPRLGVKLEGNVTPSRILQVMGYPPVAGDGSSLGIADWIPPVGFVPGVAYREFPVPAPGDRPSGTDANGPAKLPEDIATLQVVATGKYIAHVTLFDNLGHAVRHFSQSFGYRGETENLARAFNRTWKSYLVWDLKDDKGRTAGQGVYIWKIRFVFEDGTGDSRIIRTGYLRRR